MPNRSTHEHDDLHDRGLAFDLRTLMQRRHALKLIGGAAAVALVGCGDDNNSAKDTATSAATTAAATERTATGTVSVAAAATTVAAIPTTATPLSACTIVPRETGGPFPGDGSNGPNVLTLTGIVRKDIRQSIGTSTTTAAGVPLSVTLTIVDTKNACKPLAGAAVYIWHCDREGRYSLYSPGATNENYLRGVQAADANGVLSFQTIFPGAYAGRWPHIHFEVYPSLAVANSSGNARSTSQLALPEDVCRSVFATNGYTGSLANLAQTPLNRDNVFSDGVTLQMATVAGSVVAGYTATLLVGV